MRVLIVKTSSMGDILHTLPSLTDSLQNFSNICFDWVVEEDFAQIPSWHKAVNRVISIAIRRWRKTWFSAQTQSEYIAFRAEIQATHYDAIIDAQGLLKSAILATRLAHGVRYGMDWKSAREPFACLFYDYCHYITKKQHAIERIRELFSKSLGYHKPETRGNYAILRYFLHHPLQDNIPYLIFLHSTTRNNKHWPETHWRRLIILLNKSGLRIKLPWLTSNEEKRAKRLAKGFDYVDVLPRMSLNNIAQQIIGSVAVISIDTGLSHLTAALDCPNITLYGPTNPNLVGSYGKNQYICYPKNSSRLKDLSASTVFTILRALLATKKIYV